MTDEVAEPGMIAVQESWPSNYAPLRRKLSIKISSKIAAVQAQTEAKIAMGKYQDQEEALVEMRGEFRTFAVALCLESGASPKLVQSIFKLHGVDLGKRWHE